MNLLADFTGEWDFFILSFIRDAGGNFSILKGIHYYLLLVFAGFQEFLS